MLRYLSYTLLLIILSFTRSEAQIAVYAGADTTICSQSNFSIDQLQASITGIVTSGNWFSYGDGVFLPGNSASVPFGNTATYQLGSQDLSNGYFILVLVSDDPDGAGPLVQVSDEVIITLGSNPPMLCNGAINVSLDQNCVQELDLLLVYNNIYNLPTDLFEVSLFDASGQPMGTSPVLNANHIGQTLDYKVEYLCSGNSCWGTVTVNDYLPPQLICQDLTVSCLSSFAVDVIGFPFPPTATILSTTGNTFTVSGLDACSIAQVSYQDVFLDYDCSSSLYERELSRTWLASDMNGNSTSCIQKIYLEKVDVSSIILPLNLDDIDAPSLECGSSYPTDAAGFPDPLVSGAPEIGNCVDINTSYQDFLSQECGSSHKIFRSWKIIDWCNGNSLDHNQIIKVKDTTPPSFDCPDDITLFSSYVDCKSENTSISVQNIFDSCSDVELIYTIKSSAGTVIYQSTQLSSSTLEIPSLGIGVYQVEIIMIDECQNEAPCLFSIEVVDNVPPFAICNQFLKASINANGTARVYATSIDNGSFDHCGAVTFEIKKEADLCNFGNAYGEYADFCCSEIGSIISVAFRVTDLYGNQQECWSQIEVEDKISPDLVCLPDLTISCETFIDTSDLSLFGNIVDSPILQDSILIYDYYNSGFVGVDGYFTDNCLASVTESYSYNLNCGEGSIVRSFMVTDHLGNTESCIQNITIQNPYVFTITDINWPDDRSSLDCDVDFLDLDLWGKPTFNNVACQGLIESTYLDQEFIQIDSSCSKVLREWTVIDWCQFDPVTQTGIFKHTQILKQQNLGSPVFDAIFCADSTVCIFEDCSALYTDTLKAYDDCTLDNELVFSWELKDNNNMVLFSGNDHLIDAVLDEGAYLLYTLVEDRCGNLTSCSKSVTITDCKNPSPYCHSNVTIALSSPSLAIWADDFDLGSFDNCTSTDELVFSFEENQIVSSLDLSCIDILNGISEHIPIEMWVWDHAGNKEFCAVTLTLQDNSDYCTDQIMGINVSGVVSTIYDYRPEHTQIEFTTDIDEYFRSSYTDQQGVFSSDDLVNGMFYEITPYNNNDVALGITALDLFKIRRHVLGLEPLTNPVDIIAADVNNSKSVSSIDIFNVQKLILGKQDSFPNNSSWRFVPSKYEFTDSLSPFDFPNTLNIATDHLSIDSLDFMAIKIGDVNGTLKNGLASDATDSKSRMLDLNVKIDSDHRLSSSFYLPSILHEVQAFQLALYGPDSIENITSEYFHNIDFSQKDGIIKILAFGDEPVDILDTKALFKIDFKQKIEDTKSWKISAFNDHVSNEIYSTFETAAINDLYTLEDSKEELYVSNNLSVYPNPTDGPITLNWTGQSEEWAKIICYSSDGQTVYADYIKSTRGQNNTIIDLPSKIPTGIYFISLTINGSQEIKRIYKL